MAHFIRVTLVDRLQHLQNFHVMARRTHQRVVVVRLMRYRLRMDVVIIELLTGVLHALCGQQRLGGPRDILMAQAGLEMEVMLADKIVAIDIEPGDVQKFPRVQGLLEPDMARQHAGRGQAIQREDRVALAALFVHVGAVAGGDIEMCFLGHFQQRAIHARIEFIVDVRKREVLAAGGGEAGITRDRDALVFLLQHLDVLQPIPPFGDHRQAVVRRPIVHQDQFIAVQLLLFNALKELRKKFLTVVDGSHDAQ